VISGVTRIARRNGCPLALEGPIYSSAGVRGRWTFRGQSGLPAGAERAARSVKLEQREASRARVSDARTDGRTDERRAVRRASAPDGTRRRRERQGGGVPGRAGSGARARAEAETTASTDLANRASLIAAARDCSPSACRALNDRESGGRESRYTRGCEERTRFRGRR
jgi:hypothetical protein